VESDITAWNGNVTALSLTGLPTEICRVVGSNHRGAEHRARCDITAFGSSVRPFILLLCVCAVQRKPHELISALRCGLLNITASPAEHLVGVQCLLPPPKLCRSTYIHHLISTLHASQNRPSLSNILRSLFTPLNRYLARHFICNYTLVPDKLQRTLQLSAHGCLAMLHLHTLRPC
jgi:hypothetical protein